MLLGVSLRWLVHLGTPSPSCSQCDARLVLYTAATTDAVTLVWLCLIWVQVPVAVHRWMYTVRVRGVVADAQVGGKRAMTIWQADDRASEPFQGCCCVIAGGSA
jgi:hypothetical protein